MLFVAEKEAEEDEKYVFHDPVLAFSCLQGFHGLKKDAVLTDVTLVVQGEEFHCHRALLAANSYYFNAMLCGNFVETNSNKIELSEMNSATFRLVLDYLYCGDVEIDGDNVQNLFDAAHMLQLENLEAACVRYMRGNITDKNCLDVYFFAINFEKSGLKEAAEKKISSRFSKITKAAEFLHLPADKACKILELCNILLCTEEDVYAAALRWLEFDIETRKESMCR